MVTAVDEPAEAGHAVDGEGPVVASTATVTSPLAMTSRHRRRSAGSSTRDGMGGHRRPRGGRGRSPGRRRPGPRTRRTGGWSIWMRTMASGRAPSRV